MLTGRSDFKVVKQLRAGEAGGQNEGIFIVRNRRDGSKCIEKRVPIHAITHGYAEREVKAMALCSHRNICDIFAADLGYYGYGYGSIYIEHCEMGSLKDFILKSYDKRFELPENFLWKALWDMSLAICYLQTGIDADGQARYGDYLDKFDKRRGWNEIVHRDIKPDNIFLTMKGAETQYPTVVLGDFGCSITSSDMTCKLMSAWTPEFQPPETPYFSDASDIYSLALSVHCMAQLRHLPSSNSSRVRNDPLGAARYSGTLGKLLKRCLSKNHKDRPDAMYLPYLVWREWQVARQEKSGDPRVNRPLPEWAFR